MPSRPRLRPCLALALLSLLAARSAEAVPAPPFPLELQGADGSKITARMLGDEHLSWFEDLDGFAIALDPKTKDWHYARLAADGGLEAGPHRVGEIDPKAAGLAPHLRPGPARISRALAARPSLSRISPAPLRGTVPNLVILAKFKNQTQTHTPADFQEVFNGEQGSVRHYYREVSSGRLDLVSTITEWIELPEDDSYYAYNAAVPMGRTFEMVQHAIAALDAQGFDFTRFDSNADGVIDAIDVIHSGPSYETTGNSAYIHSHYAPLWSAITTHDGIQIKSYHTEAELGPGWGNITQIGVIAHESAHFFGLPDLYDYGNDSAGLGLWCLMAAGSWGGPELDGSVPSHPSAWAKLKLGFLEPIRIDASAPLVRLAPTEGTPTAALIKGDMPGTQYFMLENRRKTGYDAYLPGEGLLIFHVDEMMRNNNDQEHYLVDLEQADGRRDLNKSDWSRGDEEDPFPLGASTAFTPASKPNSVPYLYRYGSVWVTGIARDGEDVTFSVDFQAPRALGAACEAPTVCRSGFCADGACCNEACDSGCLTCVASGGAPADGTCAAATGKACDDLDPCTVDDACVYGLCRGGGPRECVPIDTCHDPGICDSQLGSCTAPRKDEGASCEDGDLCTVGDSCSYGFCQRGTPIECQPAGECWLAGQCDPKTGACSQVAVEDGTSCSIGECKQGACVEKKCGCSAGSGALPGFGLLALAALRRRRRGSRAGGLERRG